jgi:predicted nucleotidyltransferase
MEQFHPDHRVEGRTFIIDPFEASPTVDAGTDGLPLRSTRDRGGDRLGVIMVSMHEREAEASQLTGKIVKLVTLREDVRAVALVGSWARGTPRSGSDLDIVVLTKAPSQYLELDDWTRDVGALSVVRTRSWGAVTERRLKMATGRVFLLENTLQVDLSFWPSGKLIPTSPRYRELFGDARVPGQASVPDREHLVGMAWLYSLHARSSIERDRLWQAEYMVSAARDHVLALACARLELPTAEGRGFDALPLELRDSLSSALVSSLDRPALTRALVATLDGLLEEAESLSPSLAQRLHAPLHMISLPP